MQTTNVTVNVHFFAVATTVANPFCNNFSLPRLSVESLRTRLQLSTWHAKFNLEYLHINWQIFGIKSFFGSFGRFCNLPSLYLDVIGSEWKNLL